MNATKAMTLLAAVAVGLSAQALTLAVKDVKIAQRYPWNGLVDIDYTVECDDPDADVYVYPVGYDVDMNLSIPPKTLTGDGANGKAVKAGTHRMTWDMAKDMGANYNRAKFSMKVHAYAGAAPYMVIDLSAGSEAGKYQVSYMNEVPEGGWTDEYKTVKLVLRMIPPGTTKMGENNPQNSWAADRYGYNTFGDETLRDVTIMQPFYCSVFMISKSQWSLVMGGSGSGAKVQTGLSYGAICGGTLGSQFPDSMQVDADSFLGKLRSRTGVTFDIPTDAQWEHAAWSFSYGRSVVDNPNEFGLFDMLEYSTWCRNWFSTSVCEGIDPVGETKGSSRSLRGMVPYSTATNQGGTGVSYVKRVAARNGSLRGWSGGWYTKYFSSQYSDSYTACRVVAIPAAK